MKNGQDWFLSKLITYRCYWLPNFPGYKMLPSCCYFQSSNLLVCNISNRKSLKILSFLIRWDIPVHEVKAVG